MRWQSAIAHANQIDSSAAHLLDALELVRPIGASRMSRSALGRWLLQSGQDGTIADDTVVWLHHLLLPNVRRTAPRRRSVPMAQSACSSNAD
jgi:hypothetical protein